jgi:predicted metal-dependent enzyme (double-stranded beta helix superfamily)
LSLIDDTTPPAGVAGLAQLVRSVAASRDRWAGLVRYRSGERWYQRLEQTEDYELWLLSWLPGQRTGFHDHFGSAGAFAVVHGDLQEHTVPGGRAVQGRAVLRRTVLERTVLPQTVRPRTGTGRPRPGLVSAPARSTVPGRRPGPAADARVAVATFAAGQVRAFGPQHVHEVVNGSAGPAVSIHAYSPSLAGMRRYDLTPAGLVLAAVEMAEENW